MGPTPVRPSTPLTAGMTALAVAVLVSTAASAQWNNQPYQFRSTAGAGMSLAYRQAMLNEELFGRRPENLVRGSDGRLLEIIERDQQAFLADPEPDLVIRRPQARVGISVGGAGLGLGVGSPVDGWTGALDPGVAWDVTRRSSEPVDAWTGMLD